MDWDNILPILLGLLALIGLPLAFRSRKKSGPNKVEELCQHLQGIGMKASRPEEDTSQEKTRGKRSRGQKPVGTVKLKGRNIDSINVTGVVSQYGVNYYLDFLVNSPSLTGRENKGKTRMVRKKSSTPLGKVTDIEWRGDDLLAQKLNFDYQLKDKLLQADLNVIKSNIQIFPEPKHAHTRIRTTYFLPAPDMFEAIDTIAKHIKSGW